MRFVPENRPVTIHSVRYAQRWFPHLLRHSDGSLLMYISWGHDAHFAPAMMVRSVDNGKTWSEPVDHVPRRLWSHVLPDGELFDIDEVGVQDPNEPETAVYWGAWSNPGRVGDVPRREFVRVHTPSSQPAPLSGMIQGYPVYKWWPLWNQLWGREDMTADEIQISGLCFMSGLTLEDGRLLALAHARDRNNKTGRCSVFTMESRDRGKTWAETAVAARGDEMPGEPNEITVVRLKDGRLYAAMRVESEDGLFHQIWSSDDGRTWTKPEPMRLIDSDHKPGRAWPRATVLDDGTLVMVYGRPGKDLIFDPSGTGMQWQGRFDITALEKDTQALLGVPEELRIRRPHPYVRDWDSSDYLAVLPDGPRELIVLYDAQHYVENWNAKPASVVRMLRVRLED